MLVRMLDGPRKGMVQDIPFLVAQRLVDAGMAADLRAPEPAVVAVAAPAGPVVTPIAPKRKK